MELARPGLFHTLVPLASTKITEILWAAGLGKIWDLCSSLKSALKVSPSHRAVGLGSRKLQFGFETIRGFRKSTTPLGKCQDND